MVNVQVQERIDRYREILAAEPGSGVFVPLAELLGAEGEHDAALAVLRTGLARRPGSIPGRIVLARMLLAGGRNEQAREVLEGVLVSEAENLVARRLLAEECLASGARAGAVPHLEALVALEPEESRWSQALAEAQRELGEQPAAPAAPEKGFITLTMVDIYSAQGYHDRAIEALRQMLAADPGNAAAAERLRRAEAARRNQTEDDHEQAPAPPDRGRERSQRRDRQKQHFAAWIDRISRHDGEASP